MQNIEKQLSELPRAEKKHVKIKLDELVLNAIKKDKGVDLTELLKPYSGRFDMYMSTVIKECGTALSFYHEKTDEYFMISKGLECINLTKLISNYNRLPISIWLSNFSLSFFETVILVEESILSDYPQTQDTYTYVSYLFLEAVEFVKSKGFQQEDAKQFLNDASIKGEFQPLSEYKLNESNTELNELHIIMSCLSNLLVKYPIGISGNPFNVEPDNLFLDIGMNNVNFDVFGTYRANKTRLKMNPFEFVNHVENGMNEFLINQLNSSIKK